MTELQLKVLELLKEDARRDAELIATMLAVPTRGSKASDSRA